VFSVPVLQQMVKHISIAELCENTILNLILMTLAQVACFYHFLITDINYDNTPLVINILTIIFHR